MQLDDLYQELILDHGTEPRNCCAQENPSLKAEGLNPLCGDRLSLFITLSDQTIEKITFTGTGCAISMASASLMTEALQHKTLQDAVLLSSRFKNALTTETSEESLGKLSALLGVKNFPARVKCATLAWHTLEAAIQNHKTPVSTEGNP